MIENTNQNITVLMSGNPDAQSGESMLLNINNSPLKSGELGKSYYDYITSDYYIELKHGTEYITYTYVMNPAKVHSQDSNRPGVFWIGVTIPRGKQIENPYDLIIELRDKFQELYMTQLSDGSYEFINVPYKADVFKNIVDKYELVGLQSSYVEMTGTKMQTLSLKSDNVDGSAETKIRKFFDDTQYPELEEYSSVIVAEGIDGVTSIPIEVPRLIVYKVKEKVGITDKELGKISRKEPEFKSKLTKSYHKDINVEFSLNDFAFKNILQFEDNGSKYKVEKNKETITISVDYWTPEKKQISVVIKDNSEDVEKSFYDSIKLTVNNREKDISYDKDFGYYITLIGEEIGTYRNNTVKVNKKKEDDIFNYVVEKITENTIEIKVIEFNEIKVSNVPKNETDRRLFLNIKKKDYKFDIPTCGTYNGIFSITKEKIKDFTQFDIESYKYESKESYTEYYCIDPKQYDNTSGVLNIELKNLQPNIGSDNKQADVNKPNQQTGSDEPATDGKYTFIVYNEIEESVITLKKLYDNGNGNEKELIHDSVEIKNTKSVNGNHARKYEKIDIEEELKNFSIEFELKKLNDGNSKNRKSNKYKEQNKIVSEIKKDKNSTEVYIKEENKTENKHVIKATKENDIFKISTEEANTEGGKNIWCNIKNIFKRKGKGKEDNDIKTENADTKNSNLRFVFMCLLFWLVSLIMAFVFGLNVGNQRDVLPLKNIFKNNTSSEKSSGRFGCSRKTAEKEKEEFAGQIKEYLNLLRKCDKDLTFDTVAYIGKYCDSVKKPDDTRNKYKDDNFDMLVRDITVFSNVANFIKNKKIEDLSKYSHTDSLSDDIYKELKKNITPLLSCNDENDEACKEYTTFVSLIKDGTIDISKIKSFAGVLILNNNTNTQKQINDKIKYDNQLAKTEEQKAALKDECDGYYDLMKTCEDNFTFDMVDTINRWVEYNKDNPLIKCYDHFVTIKKYIPHYKAAADAIKKIDITWTTTDWFLSGNSKVLYDCYVKHTEYQQNGFNNEFRNMIEYLLGARKTCKAQGGNDVLKLTNGQSNDTLKAREINHMGENDMVKLDTTYAVLDTNKYNSIKDLLPKAKSIKSFKDLEKYKN